MSELKPIIAKNIIDLRRERGLTQAELAATLHYSDKAVSKWERGESIPDVTVLKQIADLFETTVDYLLQEEHRSQEQETDKQRRRKWRNRAFITGISVTLVWLVACCAFMALDVVAPHLPYPWLVFVFAVPASMVVWLVFNSIWFNVKLNFLIISLLMWTSWLSLWLSLYLCFEWNGWMFFIVGIPAQIIIGMWSRIKRKSN